MLNLDVWEKIGGWMNRLEGQYLYEAALALPDYSIIVEIGCYRGKSTMALLQGCMDSSSERRKKVLSIDNFSGTGQETGLATAQKQAEGSRLFYEQLYDWGAQGWFKELCVMSSQEWFEAHPAHSGDYAMFFVDGCHPEAATDVMEAWKRIRSGGVLLAHDYDVSDPGSQVVPLINALGIGGGHIGIHGTSIYRNDRF